VPDIALHLHRARRCRGSSVAKTTGPLLSQGTLLESLISSAQIGLNGRQQVKAQYDAHYQQFEAQLKPWRDAAAKPAMPEAACEHQVLAEYAFKDKDEEKAIRGYMAALDIFPTWPEGQFNLATLAGEKRYHELAVMHMKEYLELAPDSPDAQAARDSVIIWSDKLSTLLANEENVPLSQQGKNTLSTTAKSK